MENKWVKSPHEYALKPMNIYPRLSCCKTNGWPQFFLLLTFKISTYIPNRSRVSSFVRHRMTLVYPLTCSILVLHLRIYSTCPRKKTKQFVLRAMILNLIHKQVEASEFEFHLNFFQT